TLRDYQLRHGDLIRLRIQVRPAGRYLPAPFRVIGQINEFPTAPKDSFIVANAPYLASVSHSPAISTYLIKSSDPIATPRFLRRKLGRSWNVQDIVTARNYVVSASGLAATDLSGLARLELSFAVLFAFACAGLALALGIAERRRAMVILAVLGATARQRAG